MSDCRARLVLARSDRSRRAWRPGWARVPGFDKGTLAGPPLAMQAGQEPARRSRPGQWRGLAVDPSRGGRGVPGAADPSRRRDGDPLHRAGQPGRAPGPGRRRPGPRRAEPAQVSVEVVDRFERPGGPAKLKRFLPLGQSPAPLNSRAMSRTRATAARGPAAGYLPASGYHEELARLRLLQERYDARTFGRLTAFGPLAGAVCLEMGAGAGSVASWLAVQAGPSGHVVATDADPRFLAGTEAAGVEVRRHDILADPLEPARYDLVHCRAPALPSARSRPSHQGHGGCQSGPADGSWSRTPTTARSWPLTRPIPCHRAST